MKNNTKTENRDRLKKAADVRREENLDRDCDGAEEARTPDPFNAIEVLSQLSYSPETTRIILDFCVRCKGCAVIILPLFA